MAISSMFIIGVYVTVSLLPVVMSTRLKYLKIFEEVKG